MGSGGVLGQGLGQSRNKLFFLPEAHTDFILAIVGEELGLVGVIALMLAFAVLVWRGLLASLRARDVFGSFLAFAITCLFALQALANMGVVLGLLPTKGLALPFISYGGTSLVMSLFMAGRAGQHLGPQPRAARQPAGPQLAPAAPARQEQARPARPDHHRRSARGKAARPRRRSRWTRRPRPARSLTDRPLDNRASSPRCLFALARASGRG